MGACTFVDFAREPDIGKAFNGAVADARYERGHGGYTGTIAEKAGRGITVIERAPQTKEAARALANRLIDESDSRIDDKWGLTGAIRCVDDGFDGWVFFGWASE